MPVRSTLSIRYGDLKVQESYEFALVYRDDVVSCLGKIQRRSP